MRRIAATCALLALCASPVVALNPYRYLQSISVLQTAGRNMCSVTAINREKGYYLTAAHCVVSNFPERGGHDEDYRLTAITPRASFDMSVDGRPAYLQEADIEHDLAVLQVPGASRPALKLSDTRVRFLDTVTVAGHPFGWAQPTVMVGSVAAPYLRFTDAFDDFPFNKFYMILQVSGAPGNSGSSVVNEDMAIVGVVQVSWGRSFEPVLGASPFTDLVRFAAKYFR